MSEEVVSDDGGLQAAEFRRVSRGAGFRETHLESFVRECEKAARGAWRPSTNIILPRQAGIGWFAEGGWS
jgi:hypothetical protein